MKKDLSEDEKMIQGYINAVARFLRHHQSYSFKLSALPEEQKVIKYHFKRMIRHAVKEDTPLEDCMAIFNERIERLTKANKEEWQRIFDLVRENQEIVTKMTIVIIDDTFRCFTKRCTPKK